MHFVRFGRPGRNELSVDDQCVSLKEAGRILGVCVRTVRREIDRNKLRAFRAGRLWKIRMTELRRYMEREAVTV